MLVVKHLIAAHIQVHILVLFYLHQFPSLPGFPALMFLHSSVHDYFPQRLVMYWAISMQTAHVELVVSLP